MAFVRANHTSSFHPFAESKAVFPCALPASRQAGCSAACLTPRLQMQTRAATSRVVQFLPRAGSGCEPCCLTVRFGRYLECCVGLEGFGYAASCWRGMGLSDSLSECAQPQQFPCYLSINCTFYYFPGPLECFLLRTFQHHFCASLLTAISCLCCWNWALLSHCCLFILSVLSFWLS